MLILCLLEMDDSYSLVHLKVQSMWYYEIFDHESEEVDGTEWCILLGSMTRLFLFLVRAGLRCMMAVATAAPAKDVCKQMQSLCFVSALSTAESSGLPAVGFTGHACSPQTFLPESLSQIRIGEGLRHLEHLLAYASQSSCHGVSVNFEHFILFLFQMSVGNADPFS
jgi:hypothetical protein